MASSLEYSHNHTTFRSARISDAGLTAAAGVTVAKTQNRPFVLVPQDCAQIPGAGGLISDPFFVRFYADDAILVEIVQWLDFRRCLRATQSLASDHFRLLGERGPRDPSLLSPRKMSNWDTSMEVLGWTLDTEALTISLSEKKVGKFQSLITAWPRSRTFATVHDIERLTGFLLHISFVIRPVSYTHLTLPTTPYV